MRCRYHNRNNTPRHQPQMGNVKLSFCSDKASIIATNVVMMVNKGISRRKRKQIEPDSTVFVRISLPRIRRCSQSASTLTPWRLRTQRRRPYPLLSCRLSSTTGFSLYVCPRWMPKSLGLSVWQTEVQESILPRHPQFLMREHRICLGSFLGWMAHQNPIIHRHVLNI